MSLKVALPKGRLLKDTAALLEKSGWGLNDYQARARLYRLTSKGFPHLLAKMFHEKDIPIQVAVGNYDLGICGRDWVEELLCRFPSSGIVRLKNLGYGRGALFVATGGNNITSLEALSDSAGNIRIASEYPNLAESLAEQLRLKWFSIFPLWGSAEAYPPDSAELIILPRKSEDEFIESGLVPVGKLFDFKAYLIANSESLRSKDMAEVIASVDGSFSPMEELLPAITLSGIKKKKPSQQVTDMGDDVIRLALPDGHQQPHVRKILDTVGVKIDDYPSESSNRRPKSSLKNVIIRVIRPQDMPLQVANGNFDLAITGRDWLTEHSYQFPTSPAYELLDLKYGWVRIVAVASREVPIEDAAGLREYSHERMIRVATEYVNIADYYARNNHINNYRIIPTWGSTEAFLPEDADILVENTETGGTIARHNLKIIDTLFESTACLIGNRDSSLNNAKAKTIKRIVGLFEKAIKDGQV
jgi:ATP phosphoribosyltransferase